MSIACVVRSKTLIKTPDHSQCKFTHYTAFFLFIVNYAIPEVAAAWSASFEDLILYFTINNFTQG